MNKPALRKKYWSYVLAWVGLIYSTLYIVRPICTFLRKTTPFDSLLNIFMFGGIVVCLIAFRKYLTFKRPGSYVLFLIGLAALVFGIQSVKYPEEKIHFLEYGLLGILCFRALELDWPGWRAYVSAFVLCFILGWIDEGIQEILPNRYYDINDVLLNAASAFLGVLFVYVIRRG